MSSSVGLPTAAAAASVRGEWDRLWESAAKQESGVETLAKYAGLRVRSVLDDEVSWEKPVSGSDDRYATHRQRPYTTNKKTGTCCGACRRELVFVVRACPANCREASGEEDCGTKISVAVGE